MSLSAPLVLWAVLALSEAATPPREPGLVADLKGGERGRRLLAIEGLYERGGQLGEPRRALRAVLDDPDPQVRHGAARALCLLDDAVGFETVTRWLRGASPPDRRGALVALRSASRLPDGARRAVERVLGDADLETRLLALAVLDEHGAAASWRRVAVLLEDPSPPARLMAIHVMGSARVNAAAPLVQARLEDPDRQVQRAAVLALGRLEHPAARGWLAPFLPVPGGRVPGPLEVDAIASLAELADATSLPVLADLARREPPDAVARAAQDAVGRIGGPLAREILLGLLDRRPVTRETQLGLIAGGAGAVLEVLARLEALAPGIGTDGTKGEMTAEIIPLVALVQVLGEIGDARAVPTLARLASSAAAADGVRLAAVDALGRCASGAGIEALLPLAQHPFAPLRARALVALGAIGDGRAASVLPRGLADPEPAVRQAALLLYRRLGDPTAERVVLGALADRHLEVRHQALRALVAVGLRSPGATRLLLAAGPSLRGQEVLLGQGLWSGARWSDLAALTAALRTTPEHLRLPSVLGLAAAALSPQTESLAVAGQSARALLAEVAAGDLTGEVAAEGLVGLGQAAIATGALADRVRAVFFTAQPPIRARLAGVLAGSPRGREDLAQVLASEIEGDEVRAAAAFALRGARDPQARAALTRASRDLHPAVAANAQAALAPQGETRAHGVLRVRLVGDDGRALAGRWLLVRTQTGATWWTRTGQLGQAVLAAGAGPVSVGLAARELLLEDTGDGLWQIPGQQEAAAQLFTADGR